MSWAKWDAEHAKTGDEVHKSLVASRPKFGAQVAQRIRHYTGDGFSEMNRRLRSGKLDQADKNAVSALDKAVGKSVAAHDMVLLHGRRSLGDVKEGDQIHEPGFLSTTTSGHVAQTFAGTDKGNAILRVRLKTGEAALSTHGLSDNPTEKEVVLPRGQRYKVLKVQEAPGQYGTKTRLVDVEIVHDKHSRINEEPTASSRKVAARARRAA